MTIEKTIIEMAKKAREASIVMSKLSSTEKNRVLTLIAEKIENEKEFLQSQNKLDIVEAEKSGLSPAMIDRLTLSDKVIKNMSDGLREVVKLEDPVGTLFNTKIRPNGLQVSKMRIPLGVIGMIYESRPNVTIDAAGLCLKTGNAIILRGGSEAINSNKALASIIKAALISENFPENAAQVIPMSDRSAIDVLLKQEEYIDLIIPRGGEGLIRAVAEKSRIPVLKHYKGVCHLYVDDDCDIDMARKICINSKVQRPGVCNALETLLVHKSGADLFLKYMFEDFSDKNVTIRGCEKTKQILPSIELADESDWYREYLDLIISIKIVEDMDDAINHISKYSSNHTESIVTNNYFNAKRFTREVDSSAVIVNASTRFNDGGELGLGAEIGISTSKLHAFGPMGLEELTTSKFVVFGEGQIRN